MCPFLAKLIWSRRGEKKEWHLNRIENLFFPSHPLLISVCALCSYYFFMGKRGWNIQTKGKRCRISPRNSWGFLSSTPYVTVKGIQIVEDSNAIFGDFYLFLRDLLFGPVFSDNEKAFPSASLSNSYPLPLVRVIFHSLSVDFEGFYGSITSKINSTINWWESFIVKDRRLFG